MQLAQALRHVIADDFPKEWSGLVDDTKRLLSSSEIRQVETGLVVLLEIIRAFRYTHIHPYLPQQILTRHFFSGSNKLIL